MIRNTTKQKRLVQPGSNAFANRLGDILCSSVLLLVLFSNAEANENRIAHELYQQQRYAEAAEIFTDPAWKGIALYRSAQWWRAAEAFVRADDADSLFNLGNSYVQLGYYELALDAYLAAIDKQSDFADAQFNAELMRELLGSDEAGESQNHTRPSSDEIDQLDSDNEDAGTGKEGEENASEKPDEAQGNDRAGKTDNRGPNPDATAGGDSHESGSDETPGVDEPDDGGNVQGTESEPIQDQAVASASEGKNDTPADVSAGLRAKLESDQATEQWLNQIKHNPAKYLKAQIELEARRRRAAGQAPPAGGSQW